VGAPSRLKAWGLELGAAAIVVGASAAVLVIPASWRADPRPFPDATEYALGARSLVHSGAYTIQVLGHSYPPRYPFGLSALLAPAYLPPGVGLGNGVYAVVTLGLIGILCVYLLARSAAGYAGGVAASITLLLCPPYIEWSHQVMGETATAALVSGVALWLYLTVMHGADRRQPIRLFVLGLLCGLALLVRFPNAALLAAVPVALALNGRASGLGARGWAWFGIGPAAATTVLALYAVRTFGTISGTGYRFWVPYWYSSLGKTFSFSYAFTAPGAWDRPPGDVPNAVFYLTHASLQAFPLWSLLTALAGAVLACRSDRPPVRAVCVCAALFSALTLGLYSVYYYQSLRFMAPLAPFVALGVGAGVAGALRLIRDGARQHSPLRVGAGLAVSFVALAGIIASLQPSLQQCFVYQRYVRHSRSLYEFPVHSATAAAYRRTVPAGSVIATDVWPPFLDEAGAVAGNVVLPFVRKGYWASPHFRSIGTFVEQQDFIREALRQGRGVYTDSYSVQGLQASADSNVQLNGVLRRYELGVVANEGRVIIYRLEALPCGAGSSLGDSCGKESMRQIERNHVAATDDQQELGASMANGDGWRGEATAERVLPRNGTGGVVDRVKGALVSDERQLSRGGEQPARIGGEFGVPIGQRRFPHLLE
jgi:hypothetical protein